MDDPLRHVDIHNFRTIRGHISIPLHASVVLIHGSNGAGKTSVLSAIELALTGEIQALRDAEPTYAEHLQNANGACRVTVEVIEPVTDEQVTTEVTVVDGQVSGRPTLDGSLRRFFADRCFLAQSSLGRLLEIYQHSDSNTESPLVRFVNELLGLDQLDNLIAGLHAAGDERRVRRLVPELESQQDAVRDLNSSIAATETSLVDLRTSARSMFLELQSALEIEAASEGVPTNRDVESVRVLLGPDGSEDDLDRFQRVASRLEQLQSEVERLPVLSSSDDSAVLEAEAWSSRESAWRDGPGETVNQVLRDATSLLPDTPGAVSTDPGSAIAECLDLTSAEIARQRTSAMRDTEVREELARLESELDDTTAQLSTVEGEVALLTTNWDGLVEALVTIAPHISSDECPVCGRDYAELGEGSLAAHIQALITGYSAQAERVQRLAQTRSQLQSAVALVQNAIRDAMEIRWSDATRTAAERQLADLSDLHGRLTELRPVAAEGTAIIREAQARAGRVLELGATAQGEMNLRSRVQEEWRGVFDTDVDPAARLSTSLDQLRSFVEQRQRQLRHHLDVRTKRRDQLESLANSVERISALEQHVMAERPRLERYEASVAEARRRFMRAREIASAASRARAAVIGSVFSGSLNKIWRDLFVRLTPDEPYVPAFGVPTAERRLTSVQLQTLHRVGGTGGSPGAMLSTANLNTAALTLFLALHLSVEPRIRCLILDDPIQSMDEVHISQFAALVRTLSRQLDRQVLLAIHDRALFEYLRLELSPPMAGGELITVELERREGADTRCVSEFVEPRDDGAVLTVVDTG